MVTLVRSIVTESISDEKIPLDYILQKEDEVDKFNIYIKSATEIMNRSMEYFFKKDVLSANLEISKKEYCSTAVRNNPSNSG